MKKWLILLLGLFILGGCGKSSQPLSEKQAAKVFVESVIYNKSQKSFEENFVDGSAIVKEMEHSKDGEFAKALVAQISQAAAMSNEQAEKLTDSLKQALKTQTSYKIKNIKSQKDQRYQVTYEIYGVDFIGAVGKALKVSFEKIINDTSYADNDEKVQELLFNAMAEEIKNAPKTKNPVEVKIELVQKDGKWDIPSSQEKNIQSLITAFWVGFSDEKDVATALSQAVADLY
ncbi:MAG TPA: DUF5105 domain-containing protein [Candidatus Enterococcus stercoripullorum]|nr:DUF5105 domain-containing protein [Candidatus Enterococcus stercoripullorum]